MSNPVLDAALAELASAGAEVLSIEQNKRIKVRFRHAGVERTAIVPTSTSDRRAWKNKIAWLRSVVGKDHLPVRADKGERRRRKNKAPERALAMPQDFKTMPDWKEKLRCLRKPE